MATWLTTDDEDLEEFWPDAHLLRSTVLSTYLNAAKEACLAYAPAAPYAPPEFAPATLTWPNGWKVELSRTEQIVTGVLTVGTGAAPATAIAVPAGFEAAGDNRQQTYNSATAPTLVLTLNEIAATGAPGVSVGGVAPVGTTLTILWVTDPAEPVPTIPDGWRLAQALQAQNAFNANNAAPGNGDFDGGGYGITTHPLDWQVKQLLRPKRATGAIA